MASTWIYDVTATLTQNGGTLKSASTSVDTNFWNTSQTSTTTQQGTFQYASNEIRWGTKTTTQQRSRSSAFHSWGAYSNAVETWVASSLKADGQNGYFDPSKDETFTGVVLTHDNQSISGSVSTPTSFTISLDIVLSNADAGVYATTVNTTLVSGFWGTPNTGSLGFSQDIFFFVDPTNDFSKEIGDTGYYLSVASTFTALEGKMYSEALAKLVGMGHDLVDGDLIYGFVTNEGVANPNSINFTISDKEDDGVAIIGNPNILEPTDPTATPEPATMLILGLGMGGLGILGRRRFKK